MRLVGDAFAFNWRPHQGGWQFYMRTGKSTVRESARESGTLPALLPVERYGYGVVLHLVLAGRLCRGQNRPTRAGHALGGPPLQGVVRCKSLKYARGQTREGKPLKSNVAARRAKQNGSAARPLQVYRNEVDKFRGLAGCVCIAVKPRRCRRLRNEIMGRP